MDLIIKTGFGNIDHNIEFRKQTLVKAKDLCNANHVLNVEEIRKNGVSFVIRGRIVRQTSVSEPPYAVQLYLDLFRNVERTSCNCVSNKSGKCKHVAALIHYIQTLDSRTKTSLEREWGMPSTHQQVKEKYAKGARFEDLWQPRKRPNVKPIEIQLDELKKKSALRLCMVEAKKENVDHSMAVFIANAEKGVQLEIQKLDCLECVQTFFFYLNDYPVHYSDSQVKTELQEFWKTNIALTEEEIMKLASVTIQQSQSEDWFHNRRLRISASSAAHKIKTRSKKSIESLLYDFLSAKKFSVAATRYGIDKEPIARALYENLYSVQVKSVGLIVHSSQNWLCASPDGVVVKDGEVKNIVEFKCPSSCENLKIVDYEKKKVNVKYLSLNDGVVSLIKSDPIFTQCQIQMYVTGMSSCDLFIYSPVESCLVQVLRDEKFLQSVVIKCEKFYYDHYLSALKVDFEEREIRRRIFDPKVYDVVMDEQ